MARAWGAIVMATAALTGACRGTVQAAQLVDDQEPRFEVSASAAAANLFRIEDRSFGRTLNVGGGAGLRLRRQLWVGVEVNRFFGLEPGPAPCGLVNIACTGGGRSGFRTATAGSVAVSYHFASRGVHAFVTGGYGFIHARGYATVTFGDTGAQVEHAISVHGWGPSAGLGMHVPVAASWALEPGLHIYGADGPNLTVLRGSIGLSRKW